MRACLPEVTQSALWLSRNLSQIYKAETHCNIQQTTLGLQAIQNQSVCVANYKILNRYTGKLNSFKTCIIYCEKSDARLEGNRSCRSVLLWVDKGLHMARKMLRQSAFYDNQ